VRVIPDGARTYHHLDGSFVIATLEEKDVVFVEVPGRGFVLSDPEVVSQFKRRWSG
jgi:hypothetical protein